MISPIHSGFIFMSYSLVVIVGGFGDFLLMSWMIVDDMQFAVMEAPESFKWRLSPRNSSGSISL